MTAMLKLDMRRYRNYTPNGDKKLCKGFLHKTDPKYLPESYFWRRKNGARESECIECRRARRGMNPKHRRIPLNETQPVLYRLKLYFGSLENVALAIGMGRNSLYRGYKTLSGIYYSRAVDLVRQLDKEKIPINVRNKGEPEIVEAEPLGKFMRDWVEAWKGERPLGSFIGDQRNAYGGIRDENSYERYTPLADQIFVMGPISYLAEHCPNIHPRRITGVLRSEFHRVSLTQADELLTAAELAAFLGREIPVFPNPYWEIEKYMNEMIDRGVELTI